LTGEKGRKDTETSVFHLTQVFDFLTKKTSMKAGLEDFSLLKALMEHARLYENSLSKLVVFGDIILTKACSSTRF